MGNGGCTLDLRMCRQIDKAKYILIHTRVKSVDYCTIQYAFNRAVIVVARALNVE